MSYYEKNKQQMKQSAIEYYKKNKLILNNGINKKKDEHPEIYDWYIKDANKENTKFKIRHGSFSLLEDHSDVFNNSQK